MGSNLNPTPSRPAKPVEPSKPNLPTLPGVPPPSNPFQPPRSEQPTDPRGQPISKIPPTYNFGGGGGGGGSTTPAPTLPGSSSQPNPFTPKPPVSSMPTDKLGQPISKLPPPSSAPMVAPAPTLSSAPERKFEDYKPVYNQPSGNLLGFQLGEQFIPKEATVGSTGLYQPEKVKQVSSIGYRDVENINLDTGKRTTGRTKTEVFKGPSGTQYTVNATKGDTGITSVYTVGGVGAGGLGPGSSQYKIDTSYPIFVTEKVNMPPEQIPLTAKMNYPQNTIMYSGAASGLINVGTPLSLKSPKDFVGSYIKNIETSSTEDAINLALFGTSGKLVNLGLRGGKDLYKVGQVVFSKPIVKGTEYVTGFIPDKTIPGQIVKGAAIAATFPITGISYTTEIAKSFLVNPLETGKETIKFIKEKPYEFGTMVIVGGIKTDIKFPKSYLEDFKLKEGKPSSMSFGKEIKADLDISRFERGNFKVSYEVPNVVKNLYTLSIDRIFGEYKPTIKTSIGEQIIIGAKGSGGSFDIGLIPERGAKLKVNPEKFVEENIQNIPLAENPAIPKVNTDFSKVLEIAKNEKDIITGSFAQNILLDKKFNRRYKDLDLLSKEPQLTSEKVEQTIVGSNTEKAKISLQVFKNGKQIVDIVPKEEGEAGYAAKYPSINVQGIEFINPKARLASKVYQFGIGKAFYEPKILKDIELLTGGKVKIDINKATLTDPYGYTPKELKGYVGKTGTVIHASTGLFNIFKKESILEPPKQGGGYQVLFGTPFDIETGQPMARVTRLGGAATLKDIFTGNYQTETPTKPQLVIFENQKIGLDTNPIQYGKKFNVLLKSSELEVGLPIEKAKGVPNIIRKVSSAGTTIVPDSMLGKLFGKRVNLNIAEIAEADKVLDKYTLSQIKKAKIEGLTSKEASQLKESLSKQTGLDYSSETKPYLNLNRVYSKASIFSQKIKSNKIESSFSPSIGKSSNRILSSDSRSTASTIQGSKINPSGTTIGSNLRQKSSGSITSTGSYSFTGGKSSIESFSSNRSYIFPPTPPIKGPPVIKLVGDERQRSKKKAKAYSVLLRRRGKFVPVATGLPRGRALFAGEKAAMQSIARTFKLAESGTTEMEDISFRPEQSLFREYKVRKGKAIPTPNTFIQRQRKAISTPEEKRDIQLAKELKRMERMIR